MTRFQKHSRCKAGGFTLIEVLVVAAVIGLAATLTLVGYNIVFSRQLDSEVEKLNDWLEAVAESAVFRSMVLGVRADENVFQVVAYYDNRWFVLNGVEPFVLSADAQWEVETEEKIEFSQNLDDRDLEREPFAAFLPSGQALPDGQLNIHGADGETVVLSWDQNGDFEVLASNESNE